MLAWRISELVFELPAEIFYISESGLKSCFRNVIPFCKKISRNPELCFSDKIYRTYLKGFTRYVPSGYLLDLFNTTTHQRYQASFRDVYYVAPQFNSA